tara:strand:- start:674 stop:1171 length:498 start_codon:yes stop_codon:yes gene_type:complete
VNNLVETSYLINQNFKDNPHLSIRGAIGCLGETFEIEYRENPIRLRIKNMEEILQDGTELDFDLNHGWTRAEDYYHRSNWGFVCSQDRGRINHWRENSSMTDEQEKLLKPITLLYDSSLFVEVPQDKLNNVYNVRLPNNKEERSRIILALYVNHTSDKGMKEVPF